MAGPVLDDHQKFTLMKFRRAIADVLQPHHDDQFLLKWLRARSWKVEAAEKMFRESMKWRLEWEVDSTLPSWQPPEAIRDYYISGTTGTDKDGAPIMVVPFAGLDIVGMLHSVTIQDMVKKTIQLLENILKLAKDNGGNQVVVIFDMENFNLRQWAWRPAGELVITMLKMYEANYPEILKACFIINAPRIFAIAFNVVKRFLNEYTLGKIFIFKNDPAKWKRAILEKIDPDNIPAQYGGSLKDPDGNPKYASVVNQGGKVPEYLYMKNFDADSVLTKKYTTDIVKKGRKLHLDFIVSEEGSFLKWEFRTENHDIRFGISLKDSEGKSRVVVKPNRVNAHEAEETGVLTCQAPATYTVTFDNSYSLLRNKKIHYEILVTPPISDLTFTETGPLDTAIDVDTITK